MTEELAALREKILHLTQQAPDDDGVYLQAADLLQQAPLHTLASLRVAILRSFTIEPLLEALQVNAFLEGFRLEIFLGQFNQVAQEILSAESPLYQFDPQVIFLAVRREELGPEVAETLAGWVQRIGAQSRAPLLISNFLVPEDEGGQEVRSLNRELERIRDRFPQVTLFDLEALASGIGKSRFLDPVQMARMSNPYALSVYPAYARALWRQLRALGGAARKCLVLDLDNTLWGGIVAEDGIEAVQPFTDFQRAILELSERGVLLAINSKNNPEEVLPMLRSHPGMVLKEAHFSAVRINWQDKADNLREIARELNLGMEALVFMDDSPAECERVRQACPEVLVIPLPAQPSRYRSLLEGLGCFIPRALTEEDRNRAAIYKAQGERKRLADQCQSLEDFYAGLKMKATLWRNNRSQIPRIAQMTLKTNQFNLTTRRCSQRQIEQFMEQGWVYSLKLEDRFGDNGLIAVAVVLPGSNAAEWVIDNLLLSCRVVMRTIEDTLLACVAEDAQGQDVHWLVGRYLPSPKNAMTRDFYDRFGFSVRARAVSGETEYALDLRHQVLPAPSPWIRLRRQEEVLSP